MYRCLLWGTGKDLAEHINLVHYHELRGDIRVAGVTSDSRLYRTVMGYGFIAKDEIPETEIDLVIIMAETALAGIEREIRDRKLEVPAVPCRAMGIPGFDMGKYLDIRRNGPSILANNCWGGLVYHRLGMPFLSPFINMFVPEGDYIRLLQDPGQYMDAEVRYERTEHDAVLGRDYPVCSCGDVSLHFNHFKDSVEAGRAWEKRKKRINWDSLFVMMYTENRDTAEKFSRLPYKRKTCFIPFEMEGECFCTIRFAGGRGRDIPFFEIVNGTATGQYFYYDLFDLLLGRITYTVS